MHPHINILTITIFIAILIDLAYGYKRLRINKNFHNYLGNTINNVKNNENSEKSQLVTISHLRSLYLNAMDGDSIEVDVAMFAQYLNVSNIINSKFHSLSKTSKKKRLFVGISGAPGSGKTTSCSRIQKLLNSSMIISMDGFHYTKSQLNEFPNSQEAFQRRGSHWTFDSLKFVNCIKDLIENGKGKFPSFDHKVGDPIDDDIIVNEDTEIIIIEGNYLLLDIEPWNQLKSLLDYHIYIDCPLDKLRSRVIKRHMAALGDSEERATIRYDSNDYLNTLEIDKYKNKADLIIQSI